MHYANQLKYKNDETDFCSRGWRQQSLSFQSQFSTTSCPSWCLKNFLALHAPLNSFFFIAALGKKADPYYTYHIIISYLWQPLESSGDGISFFGNPILLFSNMNFKIDFCLQNFFNQIGREHVHKGHD